MLVKWNVPIRAGEVEQRTEAVGPDRERHRTEGANRREANDDANDAEEHLCGRVDRIRNWLAGLAEERGGETGQD